MKTQSTIEFLVLLGGVVFLVIAITLYFYNQTTSLNKNLTNLTNSQFNIFNLNLYASKNGNYLYGSYYQTGNYTYNKATLGVEFNGISYLIPLSTTYYKSTIGSYIFDFQSTNAPLNVVNTISNENVNYIFEFMKFNSNNGNYIFVSNQTEESKAN